MPLLHQSLWDGASRLLSRRVHHLKGLRPLVRHGRVFSSTGDGDYDSDGEKDDLLRLLEPQNPWFPLPGNVASMAPSAAPQSLPKETPVRRDTLSGSQTHQRLVLTGVDETLIRLRRNQRREEPQPLPDDLLHMIRNEVCKVFLAIDPVQKEAKVYAISLKLDIDDLMELVMPEMRENSATDTSIATTAKHPDDVKLDAVQEKELSDEDIKRIYVFVCKQIAKDFFTSPDVDDDEDGV